ncbi:DUF3071 domain-containing protein [Pseudonocardiaceae bacterium YIM PH 21723]|nr:DUF3071 domain-containing protein [Pseudonocardiaceae bacterium YIM PH 21723]
MRALRVVGLNEDGTSVILEDPESAERFTLPADARLTAAARGDLIRLGQVQIELESQMRPREIQTRIRAGASIEDIAAASGIPAQKVERFAYPVLLERSRTADLAQSAHPVREDGPDVQTLGEVVQHAFGLRGQDYLLATWDSWRGDDSKWVVQLRWRAGRSDVKAHWTFHPGAHGGTVTALDENAADLIDPNAGRAVRTVRPVTRLAQRALEYETADARSATAPSYVADFEEEAAAEPVAVNQSAPVLDGPLAPPALPAAPSAPVPEAAAPEAAAAADATEPETNLSTHAPSRKAEGAKGKSKKNHPIVPSWEDVLLGVRSQRG